MLRLLVFLAFAGALAFCGATVKLGNRTLFGHVRAIWATDEAQELKQGVKEISENMQRISVSAREANASTHKVRDASQALVA